MMNEFDKRVKALVKEFNIPRARFKYEHARDRSYRAITPKQLKYVELYLKTGDRWAAYHGAGYKPVHDKEPRLARRDIYNVHNSKGVQKLLGGVFRATLEDMGITAKDLIEKVLAAYDNAENVSQQLKAIDLLTRIVPVVYDQ